MHSTFVNSVVLHTSGKIALLSRHIHILVQSRVLVLKTILFRGYINMASVSMAPWHTNDDAHLLPEAEDK